MIAEQVKDPSINSIEEFFLTTEDVEYRSVTLPNGKIQRIGSISSADVIDWEEARLTAVGRKVSGALLITKSLVNAEGKRIGLTKPYSMFNADDHAVLQRIQRGNNAINELLLRAITRLNGMIGLIPDEPKKSDDKKANEIATAGKNA